MTALVNMDAPFAKRTPAPRRRNGQSWDQLAEP